MVKNIVRKKLCYMYSGKQTVGVSWRKRFWTTLRKGDARGSSFSEKRHPKHFKVILLKQKQKVRVIHLGKFHEWLATHLGDHFLLPQLMRVDLGGGGGDGFPLRLLQTKNVLPYLICIHEMSHSFQAKTVKHWYFMQLWCVPWFV